MLAWLYQYLGTIIVCAVLLAIVAAVIVSIVRKKRAGRSAVCDCGSCGACPMSGSCHKK